MGVRFKVVRESACMDCKRVTVIRIGPVISTRKKSTAQECVVFFCTPSVLPLRGNPPSLRGRLFVVAVNFAA